MDKSLTLKLIYIPIALLTVQHREVDARSSWDFNLEHDITGRYGHYSLPAAFNTFGTEQLRIRVGKALSYYSGFLKSVFNRILLCFTVLQVNAYALCDCC